MKFLTFLILSVFFSISVNAKRKEYLRYGFPIDIPAISAKLKLFRDLTAKPLASVEERKLTSRRGNDVKIIKCNFLKDLWNRDQHVGTWMNDLCEVSVYKILLPPPEKVPVLYKSDGKSYVTKEAFDTWKQKAMAEKREWTDENIASWLKCTFNLKFELPPEELKRGVARKATTKCFKCADYNSDTEIFYVFNSSYCPETPVVIHYSLPQAEEREHKKNLRAIDLSLSSISFYKPRKSRKESKERVFRTNDNNNSDKSPEYIASCQMIIKSIQNLPDWWYLQTDSFVMVSNVKNKKTSMDISKNLERVRNVYTQYYPIKKPLKAVSVARMFQTREGYVNFVGEGHKWSGGLWMPSKKELVVSPMDWGSRSQRRKMMVKVTFHEAFHQFIYFATGQKSTSSWFNEGNAQYFEEIKFRRGRFTIGISERDAEKMPNLTSLDKIQNLINISHDNFYAQDRDNNYTLAYGLMFFLQKGAPVLRNKNNYHEIPMKYYNAVLENTPEKANEIAWKGVDMEQFAKDFKEFWESSSLIRKAKNYNPLKD